MSNRIVPQTYRNIIDDVIKNVSVDFEEYGMEEDVLINLQAKWEAKLLETRVAEFARAPGVPAPAPLSMAGGSTTSQNSSPPEENGSNYGYTGKTNIAGPSGPSVLQHSNGGPSGYGGGLALPGQAQRGYALPNNMQGGYGGVNVKLEAEDLLRLRGGASSEDIKPKVEPNAAGLLPGDEVIDSDLDDSDDELKDEDEEGGDGWDGDIVFCVWDKVQRVKNKWKTTFKDGMIHINGKDYLFAKCTGEFEW